MALVSGDDAQDRMWAKLLALGVRNGVEDLHASGAFTDDQAPAFNRLVRDRVYEALAVLRAAGDTEPDDPMMDWVVAHFDPEADDGVSAAAPNACEDAIEAFAAEHGLGDDAPLSSSKPAWRDSTRRSTTSCARATRTRSAP